MKTTRTQPATQELIDPDIPEAISEESEAGIRKTKELTDKQKQSIPVIAIFPTIRQGVLECERRGIVTHNYFYRKWASDPVYRRALLKVREEFCGQIKDAVLDEFKLHGERLARKLVKIADTEKAKDQIKAIENVLSALGIDFGKNQKVNINDQRESNVTVTVYLPSKEAADDDTFDLDAEDIAEVEELEDGTGVNRCKKLLQS